QTTINAKAAKTAKETCSTLFVVQTTINAKAAKTAKGTCSTLFVVQTTINAKAAKTAKENLSTPFLRALRPLRSMSSPSARFVHELLHALAFVGLARVDVPPRVDGHAADAVELTGIASAVA